MMKTTIGLGAILLTSLAAGAAWADDDVTLLGPETFTRTTAKPLDVTTSFDLDPGAYGPFTLEVRGPSDSATWVYLNGTLIYGPGTAHGTVSTEVALEETNALRVRLAGKPGSTLTVSVLAAGVGWDHAADYDAFPLMTVTGTAPASYDWRTKGAVTAVADQGDAETDWAFSALGAAESAFEIDTGDLVSFSPQAVLDCGGWGTDGSPALALQYVQGNGTAFLAYYPYTGVVGECRDFYPLDRPGHVYRVPPGDLDALRWAVVLYGGVSVELPVGGEAWFQDYDGSGIVTDPECGTPGQPQAMLLVGYDDDEWILKNSWGTDWGAAGYLRLGRGGDDCGIADYALGVKY